jgi:hypothetical protein
MIKSFTAVTHDIDDEKAAVSDILRQLDLDGENTLLAHSVGILSCYSEFLDSGAAAAICDGLPFDVVGATTIAGGASGEMGDTVLALLVLTSDDVQFAVSLSEPVPDENEATLRACYETAAAKLPGKPAVMLSFVPLLTSMGGDYYVERMSAISGNVPNFGTLAVDHNADYHDSQVVLNGQAWRDRLGILLLYGPVDPVFFIGAISEDKLFPDKVAVTSSKGNQLESVNGASVSEYLDSLGLERDEDGNIPGINSFPIIVDFNDGTDPVARVMFALTPEGYAVCGGNIPVGSTLSVGSFDPDEIIETTRRTLKEALASGKRGAILMYSCVGRFFAQGYDQTAELEQVRQLMTTSDTRYLAAYSGGEICPVYGKAGNLVNRNHNNTFVILAM